MADLYDRSMGCCPGAVARGVFLLDVDSELDERYMREALHLARRGAGDVSPNPMVGAVVVSGGRIVGRGYHARLGGPHAEVLALEEAGASARGGTLYVTLEPCAHWGRTPPCADAIIGAGIRRVVAAMEDPDHKVSGGGFRRLAEAGVETHVGAAGDAARSLNEAYIKHRTTGLPFVIAKWAMTLDGRIATRSGDSRWISGEASRARVRELRGQVDAILVGIGTVLRDDPRLTVRLPKRRGPARVIVDSTLRVPRDARVLARDGAPVIVATTSRSRPDVRRDLEASGVELVVADGPAGRVDLGALLEALGRRGVVSVLVEGGGTIHGACFDAGLVDKLMVFVCPMVVGGPGPSPVAGMGVERLAAAWRLDRATVRQMGQDVIVEGYPIRPSPDAEAPGRVQEDRTRCSPAS